MKKERRQVITMTDNGIITIPNKVRMSIGDIANLFGIYYRTAKQHIRSIEKSGIVNGDYSMCCTVKGQKVHPEYYGLDMVIALAFRIRSKNAEVFREWLMNRAMKQDILTRLILPLQRANLN